MNPYFAISAIFSLGLRGIKKRLALPGPPISQFTPEDRDNGKVSKIIIFSRFLSKWNR
jgi:glutamine synthetase